MIIIVKGGSMYAILRFKATILFYHHAVVENQLFVSFPIKPKLHKIQCILSDKARSINFKSNTVTS